jgi:hypothetical protein
MQATIEHAASCLGVGRHTYPLVGVRSEKHCLQNTCNEATVAMDSRPGQSASLLDNSELGSPALQYFIDRNSSAGWSVEPRFVTLLGVNVCSQSDLPL